MIRRILDAIRRRLYARHARHARPRGDDFDFVGYTRTTIPRQPVAGRPPWETAPIPTVCMFPQTAPPALSELAPGPEARAVKEIVDGLFRKQFGTDSIAEYVEQLFYPVHQSAAA